MPLRLQISYSPRGGIPRFLRQFHDTPRLHDDEGKNYYEILEVRRDASMQEIKKSFYNLSKTHHPDLNRGTVDSSTFVKISQAYTTLSNPSLRSTYDATTFPQPNPQHHPQGSYFSSSPSPAGGRPASGLSRRRTQFRGPPPSFYRSGGWGTQSSKRSEHQPTNHQNPDRNQNPDRKETGYGGRYGGKWVFESPNSTWDAEAHLNTHTAVYERLRKARLKRMMEEAEGRRGRGSEKEPLSSLQVFCWISGALFLMVGTAGVVGGRGWG